MPFEYTCINLGTLIIHSELEPSFSGEGPGLAPYVSFSSESVNLSEFHSLKNLVVIIDRDARGNLNGIRIVKGEYRNIQEYFPFKEITEKEGDAYIIWSGSDLQNPKVLFTPA